MSNESPANSPNLNKEIVPRGQGSVFERGQVFTNNAVLRTIDNRLEKTDSTLVKEMRLPNLTHALDAVYATHNRFDCKGQHF